MPWVDEMRSTVPTSARVWQPGTADSPTTDQEVRHSRHLPHWQKTDSWERRFENVFNLKTHVPEDHRYLKLQNIGLRRAHSVCPFWMLALLRIHINRKKFPDPLGPPDILCLPAFPWVKPSRLPFYCPLYKIENKKTPKIPPKKAMTCSQVHFL